MKCKCLYVSISLSLVFLASCQTNRELSESERSTIKHEILRTHRKIIQGAEAADPKAIFAYILDNEGVVIQNGLFHKSRQDALNYTKTRFIDVKKLEYQFDDEVVEILSQDKALLKASGTSILLTNENKEFRAPFSETVIFTLKPDGWKILHAHQSTRAR